MAEPCPFCGGRMEGGNIFHFDRPCLTCTSCSLVIDGADADRRTPGPATKAMLEKVAATAGMFKTKQRGSGFGANISFTLDEMRDLLAEWADTATPPKPKQPGPSSPWHCVICGKPVRIGDDLRPYHLAGPDNHDAELSDADKQILIDTLNPRD